MLIMIPWTPAIAYRRFQQGLLIRFGRSRLVGIGTAVRLGTNVLVLAAGFAAGRFPGIVVGTAAVAIGVIAEAVYVGIVVRPILRGPLREAPPPKNGFLTLRRLFAFYIPLAVSPLLATLAWLIISAAVSRMPRALESLAVWPVLAGLTFTLRSLGFAYNEVVVVALDRREPRRALNRFTLLLASAVSAALLLVALTPLGRFWFVRVSGLEAEIARLALLGIWFAVPAPAFTVIHSFFQGKLVHAHRTADVTMAVSFYVTVTAAVLYAGIVHGQITGLFYGLWAVLAGYTAQAVYLWWRSRRLPMGA